MTDVVELTREMCAIPSITDDDENEIVLYVNHWNPGGYTVQLQSVGDSESRFNLLATRPNAKPEILLTTHLDTVPPFIAPYDSEGR